MGNSSNNNLAGDLIWGAAAIATEYGPHAPRHFYAAWLIEQNFVPKRVRTIPGHSTITVTYDTCGLLFPAPDDDNAKLAAGELALVG
jgi:integrase